LIRFFLRGVYHDLCVYKHSHTKSRMNRISFKGHAKLHFGRTYSLITPAIVVMLAQKNNFAPK